MGRLENGTRNPTVSLLKRLVEVIGMELGINYRGYLR
ncbi:hypothetical protein [Lachnoanaerobaculum gingivalis]